MSRFHSPVQGAVFLLQVKPASIQHKLEIKAECLLHGYVEACYQFQVFSLVSTKLSLYLHTHVSGAEHNDGEIRSCPFTVSTAA